MHDKEKLAKDWGTSKSQIYGNERVFDVDFFYRFNSSFFKEHLSQAFTMDKFPLKF